MSSSPLFSKISKFYLKYQSIQNSIFEFDLIWPMNFRKTCRRCSFRVCGLTSKLCRFLFPITGNSNKFRASFK